MSCDLVSLMKSLWGCVTISDRNAEPRSGYHFEFVEAKNLVTYSEVKQMCIDKGQELFTPKTREMYSESLTELFMRASFEHTVYVWMDLTDIDEEGTWAWGGSDGEAATWGAWSDDFGERNSEDRNCVYFGITGQWKGRLLSGWKESDCELGYWGFICQTGKMLHD